MTASPGQLKLADDLYAEREIPSDVWNGLQRRLHDPALTPGSLRGEFDRVIKANYPRRGSKGPRPADESPWPDWSDTQQSKYALPSGVVSDEVYSRLATMSGRGEALFFEVKEYRGKWYCKKLVGAPGSFSRYTISAADQQALHAALAPEGQQERASRLFGYLHKCCGVCGADLTDDYSREVMMGPHCRKSRYGHKR